MVLHGFWQNSEFFKFVLPNFRQCRENSFFLSKKLHSCFLIADCCSFFYFFRSNVEFSWSDFSGSCEVWLTHGLENGWITLSGAMPLGFLLEKDCRTIIKHKIQTFLCQSSPTFGETEFVLGFFYSRQVTKVVRLYLLQRNVRLETFILLAFLPL